ncbi:MAG: hypothetical protein HC850_00420 [Rhodomicrobium sp.]|nr:hypothetical protein [Rhodomicrobium sp.]
MRDRWALPLHLRPNWSGSSAVRPRQFSRSTVVGTFTPTGAAFYGKEATAIDG